MRLPFLLPPIDSHTRPEDTLIPTQIPIPIPLWVASVACVNHYVNSHHKVIMCFLVFVGTMFALVASLEVLDMLIASVIFNSIYSATVDWMPGFSYYLMSGMSVVPVVLMM